MPPSRNDFLDHVKWLRAAVQAGGGDLLIAGDSLEALIRRDGQHWVLYPQFVVDAAGLHRRSPALTDDVTHFAGWLPYRNRRWPVAADKLVFKHMAAHVGLPVPEFALEADAAMDDVVVKRAGPSTGCHIRGPFRRSAECPLNMAQGDYYERFVAGDRLRLWCLNGRALCVEVEAMPCIIGNGLATVRDLAEQHARLGALGDAATLQQTLVRCEASLRYQGVAFTDQLAAGMRHWVDFRHDSSLTPPHERRVIDLRGHGDAAWDDLIAAGRTVWEAVPAEARHPTLFTVDAVRSTDQHLWFLAMDSQPPVHPLAYPDVVAELMSMPRPQPDASMPNSGKPRGLFATQAA